VGGDDAVYLIGITSYKPIGRVDAPTDATHRRTQGVPLAQAGSATEATHGRTNEVASDGSMSATCESAPPQFDVDTVIVKASPVSAT